jgi:multidrug resistance protein, MATE family
MISQLGHTLVHTADSMIVGHFAGTIALAAVSLVNAMFMMVMVTGIGISYGLTPLIAQENGKDNKNECGVLLVNSLVINLLTALVLFCIVYLGLRLVIDHIGQAPKVVREAKPFLALLGLSIIPLMVFNTFKQFAEGLGFTRQAMVISVIGNLLNVALGIVLVKGMFGIPPMGVIGVGISTLTDRVLMSAAMAFYVFRSENFREYLRDFRFRISKSRIAAILRLGIPVAFQYGFEVTAFGGANLLMGTLGAVYQAAHQIAIALASMTYMMASGLAAAATITTGNNFGRQDFRNLRYSANASYHIVLVLMSVTALVFILFNDSLPWLFSRDQVVISLAAKLLIIAGLFQLADGTQVVGLGILRGIGDVNKPALITFIAYWVIGIPVAWLLGFVLDLGASGVWYGLTLGLLASAVMLRMRIRERFSVHSSRLQP